MGNIFQEKPPKGWVDERFSPKKEPEATTI
jgi:hypothetical protein